MDRKFCQICRIIGVSIGRRLCCTSCLFWSDEYFSCHKWVGISSQQLNFAEFWKFFQVGIHHAFYRTKKNSVIFWNRIRWKQLNFFETNWDPASKLNSSHFWPILAHSMLVFECISRAKCRCQIRIKLFPGEKFFREFWLRDWVKLTFSFRRIRICFRNRARVSFWPILHPFKLIFEHISRTMRSHRIQIMNSNSTIKIPYHSISTGERWKNNFFLMIVIFLLSFLPPSSFYLPPSKKKVQEINIIYYFLNILYYF